MISFRVYFFQKRTFICFQGCNTGGKLSLMNNEAKLLNPILSKINSVAVRQTLKINMSNFQFIFR